MQGNKLEIKQKKIIMEKMAHIKARQGYFIHSI